MRRLQSVLNAAARHIFHLRRSDHISDALICLHWLRVPERVEFKIALLTHKVLCGLAPRYLGPLNRVTDISGRRSLRSSGTNRLVVPPFRLYRRQPSFIGCRRQDLERIAGQSRFHNITFVLSAPSENILVPEILLIALQWT